MADINDIVLIHLEDKPISFARIERIDPDIKPGWFKIKFFLLQIPLQSVVWILRAAYINGTEFTMSGKRMRIEQVVCPEEDALPADESPKTKLDKESRAGDAKVIDMRSLLKKR
jgi:hypothetical protein